MRWPLGSLTATFFRPSGQKLHTLTLVLNLCTMAASLHGPLSSVPNVAVVERELQLYLAAFLNFRLNFWRYSPSSVWCMKFKLLIHQITQKVRVPLKVWFMINLQNLACGCEHLQANSKGRNLCATVYLTMNNQT